MSHTVSWEIFPVKTFLSACRATKIKCTTLWNHPVTKYFNVKIKTPIIFSEKFPNLWYLVNHWTRGDWKLTVSSATWMEPAKTAHYMVKFTRTAHVFFFFAQNLLDPCLFWMWNLLSGYCQLSSRWTALFTVVSSPDPTLLRGETVWWTKSNFLG